VGVCVGARVGAGVGGSVSVGGTTTGVLLGSAVALGRAAAVAPASAVGVGLKTCGRKAGMQAFRARERLNASRSVRFMPNSLWMKRIQF
jgi:hypothetical protein